MIHLSRLTDYAVALLSYMGEKGADQLWAAPDLAEKAGLPMPTVSKILKLLSKSGLVTAQRGASGGYRLSRPTADISVAEIIEAMDGPIALTDCANGVEHTECTVKNICPMTSGWNKVNLIVRKALRDVSLAEMSAPPLQRAMGE